MYKVIGSKVCSIAGGEHALYRDGQGGGERQWGYSPAEWRGPDGRSLQLALYDPGRGVGG